MDTLSQKFEAAREYLQRPINEVLPPSLLLYLIPPLPPLRLVLAFLVLGLLLLARIWSILPSRKSRPPPSIARNASTSEGGRTVGVFLGSGGHTAELLQLVSALPTDRYAQRIYLVSSGDRFSLEKAKDLERRLSPASTTGAVTPQGPVAKVIQIPRARKVHQSFLTTPLSLAHSIAFCVDQVALRPLLRRFVSAKRSDTGILADVILMNGPGTCVPIVASVYVLRVSGLSCGSVVEIDLTYRLQDTDIGSHTFSFATGARTAFAQTHLRRVVRARQELLAHSQAHPSLCRPLRPSVASRPIKPQYRASIKTDEQHRLLWLARLNRTQLDTHRQARRQHPSAQSE